MAGSRGQLGTGQGGEGDAPRIYREAGKKGERRAVLDSGRRRGGKWKGIDGVQCRTAGGQLVAVQGDPKPANLSACLPVLRPCPRERPRASSTWRRGCGCPDSKVPCFALISLLPTDRTLQFRARFTGNPLHPAPGGFLLCAGVQQSSDSLRVMGWAVSTAAVTHATRVRRRIQVGACMHRSVTCRGRSARRRDGEMTRGAVAELERCSDRPLCRPAGR